jgi:hypothetical protein
MAIATVNFLEQNAVYRCQGGHDEQTLGAGRPVDPGRAAFAQASVRSWRRQAACAGSRLSLWDYLRAQDRPALGGFSPGDGLLRHDAVESPQRVAPSRRLGPPASSAVGQAPRVRRDRLFPRRGRFVVGACGARGKKTGPSPVDRRKNGSKHHLAVDANGIPLACILTAASRHDVTQLIPLIDAIGPIRGKVGAPLRKPQEVMADRAYQDAKREMTLCCRGIKPTIAHRGQPHGSGLGIFRYVVEQAIALLHQFRRLRTRFDKRDDIHEAFMTLGCAIMCWRRLHTSCGYF